MQAIRTEAVIAKGRRLPRDTTGGAGKAEQIGCRRLALGAGSVDFRKFETQRVSQLTPTATVVHLIIPLAGRMLVVADDLDMEVSAGMALLLARPERVECTWSAGMAALVIHLQRNRVQAHATRAFDTPCRLAGLSVGLAAGSNDPLGQAAATLLTRMEAASELRPSEAMKLEDIVMRALVDSVRGTTDPLGIFIVARSVKRAVDHVRTHPEQPCTVEDLAAVAGVTVATLRRNFKSCLGAPITGFVQQTRLEWLRTRLGCETESRSIRELAEHLGFSAPGTLARAYQRRFDETPTQTRARAFAMK
jgi:AraC-like DNA-binding protein